MSLRSKKHKNVYTFRRHLRCRAQAGLPLCLEPREEAVQTCTPVPSSVSPKTELSIVMTGCEKGHYLDVLQRQILRCSSSVSAELRSNTSNKPEQMPDSCDNGVHVQVDMITGGMGLLDG